VRRLRSQRNPSRTCRIAASGASVWSRRSGNRRAVEGMGGGGIAIVRALHLGDMLCAVPALRAFRAGFPDSRITLIGLPWATELMPWLASWVDDLVFFPGYPGIPECQFDAADVTAFLAHMQSRQFDLAVQLHGSGAHINEFTLLFGAHRTAVYRTPEDAVPLEGEGTAVPWPTRGSEIERLLALPYALGCPDVGTALGLAATADDRAALGEVGEAAGLLFREYACVHAGARFPSPRWPTRSPSAGWRSCSPARGRRRRSRPPCARRCERTRSI